MSGRVLIVDDELTNLVVLRAMVEHFGYEVEEAWDGAAALARLGEPGVDRLLLDIHMPGLSGIEVTRRLRASSGPYQQLPIVAVTADATLDLAELIAAGFDDRVLKPISLAVIGQALRTCRAKPGRP